MFELKIVTDFAAAHQLKMVAKKCENLHGHRFQVKVNLRAKKTNDIGITYDFVELRQHLRSVLEKFDHCCLNEIAPFDTINPSSENIAETIYVELSRKLNNADSHLHSIQVWESPESTVTYYPDEA